MGFLDGLFKKGDIEIFSPVKGKCVSIHEVSDSTFGEEIIGKGVALIPENGDIYAPADGEITALFPTYHAVAVTTTDGAEVLVHIGLDTVNLEGKGYTCHVKKGQKVKKGDLLIQADIEQIKAEGYDVITPVVICNTPDYSEIEEMIDKQVMPGEVIMKLKR